MPLLYEPRHVLIKAFPDHVMVSASCLGAQKRGLFRYQTGFRAMHSRLRMGQSTRGHYAI